jgi:hypothetical protein
MPAVDNARVYGSITKVEKQADGTLYVEGDRLLRDEGQQGEIVKASAIAEGDPRLPAQVPRAARDAPADRGREDARDRRPAGRHHVHRRQGGRPDRLQEGRGGRLQGLLHRRHGAARRPQQGRPEDHRADQVLNEISLVDRPANPDACSRWSRSRTSRRPYKFPRPRPRSRLPPRPRRPRRGESRCTGRRRPARRACTRSAGARSSVGALASLASSRSSRPTSRATAARSPPAQDALRRAGRHPQGPRRRGSRRADDREGTKPSRSSRSPAR